MAFFCQITLANTTNKMLNSSGNSGHPFSGSDLLMFSQLSKMLSLELRGAYFNMLKRYSSIPILLNFFFFNQRWVLDFVRPYQHLWT